MNQAPVPTFRPNGSPQTLLDRVRVVLCRTSHPGNIGAAARAMKTMGLSRMYLVSPMCELDSVAEARAAGATDVLSGAVRCAGIDAAGCAGAGQPATF